MKRAVEARMRAARVVVHYAEIGLKKKNRAVFENRLIANMRTKLQGRAQAIKKEPGQIVVTPAAGADEEEIADILKRIPGISYFSFSFAVELEMERMKAALLDFLQDREFETFKIDTRRREKSFPLNSMALNNVLGELVCSQLGKKAQMTNPDLTVKLEISTKRAYISGADTRGVGGLPTDKKQKVVALLSGGIDSPVAAYLMMKRGCRVILVHFQNQQIVTHAVEDKILQLAEQLCRYQVGTLLYIVPFESIQKEIIMQVRASYRMLIYRRFMIRIAEKIAQMNRARFLVVGDNLSQVASQTYENLAATYQCAQKPILAPLIGLDKKEIVDLSKEIGTYPISILPYGDCCTYFLPKHPVLHASARELQAIEKGFAIPSLVDRALSDVKISEWPQPNP